MPLGLCFVKIFVLRLGFRVWSRGIRARAGFWPYGNQECFNGMGLAVWCLGPLERGAIYILALRVVILGLERPGQGYIVALVDYCMGLRFVPLGLC